MFTGRGALFYCKNRLYGLIYQRKMDVCFFGGYDSGYPRNAVIRQGLKVNGINVSECRVNPGGRFWARYPLLLSRWLSLAKRPAGPPSFIFVPEFCQKDVPLARFLALLSSCRLVFDPLASRFETKITDWKRKPEGSLAAWWNRVIDLWAFRFSDLVLADTQAHKDYYCRRFGLDAQKIEVLPVGFDDRIFSENLITSRQVSPKANSPFTVLFFGSFLPLHGVDVIIRAAQQVWQEDRTIRFEFIGRGQTYPLVSRLAADLGLENVRLENWVSRTSLATRIARDADICLGIFGRTEKAGRVVPHKIFQSMALRKPVITSRTPAVQEFFSHRKNIFLCEKAEPTSLARAILELKNQVALREEIARKGFELAWEKFHPAVLGGVLKGLLEKHFLTG
jgi:glycosyltransferase involved in cell wall biosynthesis